MFLLFWPQILMLAARLIKLVALMASTNVSICLALLFSDMKDSDDPCKKSYKDVLSGRLRLCYLKNSYAAFMMRTARFLCL